MDNEAERLTKGRLVEEYLLIAMAMFHIRHMSVDNSSTKDVVCRARIFKLVARRFK